MHRPLNLLYDAMAADTIAFLTALGCESAHVLGWSDGGIVGLLVAMVRPDLVRKLVVSARITTSPAWS